MKTQERILRTALAADIPVALIGPPGTGKTAVVQAMARRAGAHLETLVGSTLDPVDVGGQPVPAGADVVLAPPAWARRLYGVLREGRPAWLFLDELSCAPPSVQAALLRVVHERRVAELDLTGCRVIAAYNPAEFAADGGGLSAAMSSRWAAIHWSVDPRSWAEGEASGWGRPMSGRQAAASGAVAGFVVRHPTLLLVPPTGEADHSAPWPCPRTWSFAARLMAALEDAGETVAAVTAVVGPAAASEFATWLAARDLPDPEEILAGRGAMPTRGDQLAASAIALASAALAEHDKREARVRLAWTVLATSGRPDQTLSAARVLADGAPEILTPELVALGERLRLV